MRTTRRPTASSNASRIGCRARSRGCAFPAHRRSIGCCACWRRRWIAVSRRSSRWRRTRCSPVEPDEGFDCFAAAFWGASGARLESLRRGLELIPAAAPYLGLFGAEPRGARTRRARRFSRRARFAGCRSSRTWVSWSRRRARSCSGRRRAFCDTRRARSPTSTLTRALGCADLRAREVAVESGLILGLPEAWRVGRALALADVSGSAALLPALAMLGTAGGSRRRAADALAVPSRQREAIWALGFGGRRSGADACVDLLAQQQHVGLAAEAFCAITGLDLAGAGLVAARARADDDDDEPPLFEDDDLDAALVPRAEDRLPEPDVSGVIRWWNQNRARFDPGVRYLGGQPTSLQRLAARSPPGRCAGGAPIAFELAVRTHGRLQIETRAFIAEQRGAGLWRRASAEPGPRRRRTSGSRPITGVLQMNNQSRLRAADPRAARPRRGRHALRRRARDLHARAGARARPRHSRRRTPPTSTGASPARRA